MQYELYVDSLLLVNFVMNLYLLILVSRNTLCTATPGRLIAGAACGALSYFLPFLLPGPAWVKVFSGMALGAAGMICIAFRIRRVRMFFKILEKLLIYSFFLGGLLLFLVRSVPALRNGMMNIFSIMGIGAAGFLVLSCFFKDRKKDRSLCRATLIRKDDKITVEALMDSGNTLVEPISGKPVSIIGKNIYQSLWKEEEAGFRAIPYHSIGKKRGILQGYLLPELQIEVDGEIRSCKDVYVAVSEEIGGDSSLGGQVKMILNPALLQS